MKLPYYSLKCRKVPIVPEKRVWTRVSSLKRAQLVNSSKSRWKFLDLRLSTSLEFCYTKDVKQLVRIPASFRRAHTTWKKTLSFLFPIGVLVGIVAAIVLVMNLSSPGQTQAAWMDLGWGFRQRIAFTNSGSADSYKKISLSIDTATLVTAGQLQSGCQDLRFTDQQGKMLQYYINTSGGACNTGSTNVFVLLPVIVTNANDIFMYYGNPNAPAGTQQSQFGQSTFSPGTGPTANTAEVGAAPSSWWKFDDGTGTSAKDSSIARNTGTLTNIASPPSATSGWQTEDQCESGKCLRLDGSNDYVALSYKNIGSTVTYEMWFNATNLDGTARNLFSYMANLIRISSTQITWYPNTSISSTSINYTFANNTWYHLAISQSGSTYTLYINGKQAATGTTTSSITVSTSNDSSQIGAYLTTANLAATIDDVKAFGYARSAAQIQADYLIGATGIGSSSVTGTQPSLLSNGLVGYWKMDESSWTNNCSTTSVTDATGNGLNGAACPNSTGPTGGANGKFGYGALLDGSDDYISVADSSNKLSVGSGSHTVSAWVKTSTSANIIVYYALSGSSQEYMYVLSNGKVRYNVKDDSANELAGGSFDSTSTVNNGAWHLVTGVWDTANNIAYIYIDGKQDASTTSGASSIGTSATTGTKYIGRTPGGSSYFTGSMDEVRVYNRALSASDVSQLYSFAPGPIGYWKFDEGSGGSVNDVSGSNNTGTWVGTGSHWGNGKYGKAGTFNAIDDKVTITNIALSKSFTHEFWFYPTCNINQISLFTGTSSYVKFNASGAGLEIGGGWLTDPGTGHSYVTGTYNSTSNVWQHLAVSFDIDTNTLYMYKNGALIFTQVITRNSTPNLSVLGDTAYCGAIDDVKVYNYVRTAAQITEDMQGTNSLTSSDVGGGSASNTTAKNAGTKPNNALGYWKFNEGQGTTANNSGSLGSSANGTLTNMASPATSTSGWTSTGKVNRGIIFDGTDDYVNISDNTALDSTTDISISAWFKTTSAAGSNAIFSKSAASHATAPVYLYTSAGSVNALVGNGTSSFAISTPLSTYNDGNWHHTTLTIMGSTLSVYVDGTLKVTQTFTGTRSTNTNAAYIGRADIGTTYFSGALDEVKFFAFALTPEQVRQEYNLGTAVTYGGGGATESASLVDTAGSAPVGYWNLDEHTGTTAKDSSGNENTGTLTTSPVWVSGKIGSGVNFAPASSYISVANNATLNITADLTVEAWVKPNVIDSTSRVFLEKGDGTTAANRQYAIRLNSSNKWEFFLYTGSTTNSTADNTTVPSTSRWDHVVGVRSGNTIYIYVNGIQRSSTTVSGATNTSTSILAFGRAGAASSGYFGGQIDDIKIYNYARTTSQIAYDYNRGLPAAWWKMDECQGTTINNSMSPTNTGTLTIGSGGTQSAVGTCNTSSTAWGNGASGKINASIKLDGTDDVIDAGANGIVTGSNPFTMAAWLKGTPNGGYGIAMMMGFINGSQGAFIGWVGTAQAGQSGTFGGGVVGTNLGSGVNDSNWHHVLMSYSGGSNGTLKLFVDGTLKSSSTLTPALLSTSIYFGKDPNSGLYPYTGQIDDARIYNYALSTAQVQQLYNRGAATYYGP